MKSFALPRGPDPLAWSRWVTQWLSHTYSNTFALCLTHTQSHNTHTHSLPHSHILTHSYTLLLSHTFSNTYTLSHIYSKLYSLTHTHFHTPPICSYTHSHTFSLTLFLTHKHTHATSCSPRGVYRRMRHPMPIFRSRPCPRETTC